MTQMRLDDMLNSFDGKGHFPVAGVQSSRRAHPDARHARLPAVVSQQHGAQEGRHPVLRNNAGRHRSAVNRAAGRAATAQAPMPVTPRRRKITTFIFKYFSFVTIFILKYFSFVSKIFNRANAFGRRQTQPAEDSLRRARNHGRSAAVRL